MHATLADDRQLQRQAFVLRFAQQPIFRQRDLQVEGSVTVDGVVLPARANQADAAGAHLPQPVPRAAGEVESDADGDVALRQRTHKRHPAAQEP